MKTSKLHNSIVASRFTLILGMMQHQISAHTAMEVVKASTKVHAATIAKAKGKSK